MRGNVFFYVPRQYMKKNRKRTLTAFFGIFFMVMLMTCVFVGKETAFDFLETLIIMITPIVQLRIQIYTLNNQPGSFIFRKTKI